MKVIETEADLAAGFQALIAIEPRFHDVRACVGDLPLRRRTDGFGALLDAIVGQQVSVASATAIRGRVVAAGFGEPAPILAAPEDDLRACGLSRQKVRYLRALAEADVDFNALRTAPDATVYETLVAISGIGRWTAEMYLLFALGRVDVFAPDDMALQEGAKLLFDLPERPKGKAMGVMAQAWSPWRSVAARALWAYYGHTKSRQGETL
ncbi:DNA-3-methyladenine glycosylase family protein [Albirhodobacter sp. R86504]|uniref:DNA-3-methyladenine glycosylase family protein n=1 Tax=Albirhodobacter sp. R86504 TaxID=3093848 RepID=UPI0036728908